MNSYRDIAKLLGANAGANRLANVFDDFVEMTAISFRNTVDRHEHAEREAQYLSIARKYTRAQLDRFAHVLALITHTMGEEPSDVLGRLYMELDLGNERLGQFYTPYDVAQLMAAMNVVGLFEQVQTRGFATLYEPACGAGAFVVAMSQQMRKVGLNYQTQLHVTTEDISTQAVHMAYIHLTLLHIPAVVHRRDTLTQETFDSWYTPAHILGGWTSKLRPANRSDTDTTKKGTP